MTRSTTIAPRDAERFTLLSENALSSVLQRSRQTVMASTMVAFLISMLALRATTLIAPQMVDAGRNIADYEFPDDGP